MIEILQTNGAATLRESPIAFEEIQTLVGGHVELVTIQEQGQMVQCCCNEDGRMKGLPYNALATKRFQGKINNAQGAVGTWVILTGKDLLK